MSLKKAMQENKVLYDILQNSLLKELINVNEEMWAMRDLNSRLPPCKGGTLNQLS